MSSFLQLQSIFAAYQATAIGFGPNGMQNFQGAVVPPGNDDQFLWDLFNIVPLPGPLFKESGNQFFDSYAAVIESLTTQGNNPLDPVAAAKEQLKEWGSRPPAWDVGYAKMKKRLGSAPTVKFSFNQQAEPQDDFWGLWARSEAVAGVAGRFAVGEVHAAVEFRHLLNFAPTPDDWYVSTAMSYAYRNPDHTPWNPASPITWESTFGPDGTLHNIVTSLVCVSDISVNYTSSSSFTAAQQDQIMEHVASGMWPYYLPSESARTSVTFNGAGAISVSIVSNANVPILIGATVAPARKYFGGA